MSEFKPFNKIENIKYLTMTITQKIHGTNAQIYIYRDENNELQLKAGSRTKWLYPGKSTDNFGFARFAHDQKEELIELLGEGRHFGEWAGPGINSGEGLKEKTFFLFAWWTDLLKTISYKNICTVPILAHNVPFSSEKIEEIFNELKEKGSRISPGYMLPEGIVIQIKNTYYKKVFHEEEIKWKGEKIIKIPYETMDVSHLLQPMRLQKLLSRDEQYLINYPKSITNICKDYIQDLIEEKQLSGNESEINLQKKSLGRSIFPFIKKYIG